MNGDLFRAVIPSLLHFFVSPSPNVPKNSASLHDSLLRQKNSKSTQNKRQIVFRVLMLSGVFGFTDWQFRDSKPNGTKNFQTFSFLFTCIRKTAKSEY
jgi:hypothetical protein